MTTQIPPSGQLLEFRIDIISLILQKVAYCALSNIVIDWNFRPRIASGFRFLTSLDRYIIIESIYASRLVRVYVFIQYYNNKTTL